jgi:hypothetical protein
MISKFLLASAIGDALFRVCRAPISRGSTLRFNEQRERERENEPIFGFSGLILRTSIRGFLKVCLLEASSPLHYSSGGEVLA